MTVELKDLTKNFCKRGSKTKEIVTAVDHISIQIPDGKLIALLGPSGCGKSTMLNMICGLENPSEGKIIFDGTDVTDLPPEKRGVGMVFQNYALYPHMTVRQNIMFPLGNLKGANKIPKEEQEKLVKAAASLVQIENYMDRRPGELSGGQQQRVAIARAMVKTPKLLLLDEPLSNLDARLRLQTREEIRRIQCETGVTTIFVTHDQDEAMSISDLIVVMKLGALQQIGKPQEVYDNPSNLFVAKFLGTPTCSIFNGEIRDGVLFIGEDSVLSVNGLKDQKVTVAVRPEGFVPDENGKLLCSLKSVETMGRDTSFVFNNPDAQTENMRAIASSEDAAKFNGDSIRFNLKPNKVYLFDLSTEKRIYVQ